MSILKHAGPGGGALSGGCGRGESPFPIFFFQIVPKKKIQNRSYLKTENCLKKVIYAKNKRQINSNLPCKFGHFWRKLNFWTPAQMRYDLIWNFTPISIFSTLRIFYVKLATSEAGGEVCIVLVGKRPWREKKLSSQNNRLEWSETYAKTISDFLDGISILNFDKLPFFFRKFSAILFLSECSETYAKKWTFWVPLRNPQGSLHSL